MATVNDKWIRSYLNDNKVRVNDLGIVQRFNIKQGIWEDKCILDHSGYRIVTVFGRRLKAHRIAYLYFYGSLDPKMQVNHINGNKADNRKENLELTTASENMIHYRRFNGIKKISFDKAKEIKNEWLTGKYTQNKLAEKYDCSQRTVERICSGYGRYADFQVCKKANKVV